MIAGRQYYRQVCSELAIETARIAVRLRPGRNNRNVYRPGLPERRRGSRRVLGAAPGEATLEDVVMAEFQQNPDADWQQQKAGEIANSLQKGKHGSWREMFTPRDRQIFHEIAGETLNQWGYKE